MQYDSLAADLKEWLKDNIGRGFAAEALVQSLRAAGYQVNFAREAVALAMERHGAAGTAAAASASPEATGTQANAAQTLPTASEIIAATGNAIDAGDRAVRILFALNAPRVVLFEGLLSAQECDELVALSATKLQRSTVVNAATGDYDVHPDRTSSGTHFERGENPLISRIETRIAELVGMPVERGEPIQILHYTPGAEYKPHFDFFDPNFEGNEKVLAMGGQRVATLIMYLNDVDAGGSTIFPDLGLDVLPRKGNAVYFAYLADNGVLDRRTLHGGSPVTQGEKWIATKWIREREYRGPGIA